MSEKKANIQIECCICRKWRDLFDHKNWVDVSSEERRRKHFESEKLSHSYCPECHILNLREMGLTSKEIQEIVSIVEKQIS
jgi:hypothetical protein